MEFWFWRDLLKLCHLENGVRILTGNNFSQARIKANYKLYETFKLKNNECCGLFTFHWWEGSCNTPLPFSRALFTLSLSGPFSLIDWCIWLRWLADKIPDYRNHAIISPLREGKAPKHTDRLSLPHKKLQVQWRVVSMSEEIYYESRIESVANRSPPLDENVPEVQ